MDGALSRGHSPTIGGAARHDAVVARLDRRNERKVERWKSLLDPERNSLEGKHVPIAPRKRDGRANAGADRDDEQARASGNAEGSERVGEGLADDERKARERAPGRRAQREAHAENGAYGSNG